MLGITLSSRYSIIRHLGGGGFAQTYLAEDSQLPGNHLCVVKQLKPQATDPNTLQVARRLFDTEAQVLYKLGNHDRIPRLFAYFEENQEFYLVQEFIEGHDLNQEIQPPQTLGSPPYQGGAGFGSPPYQGGAGGGLKYSATHNKIPYNNDKTLQQKLRKIQAAEASQRNDTSGKGFMETDQKQTAWEL